MKSLATMVGIVVIAAAAPLAALAQDAAMTCPQITQNIGDQNAIIKQQSDMVANLNAHPADPGDPDPNIARQKARIKTDRATARASQLVALGKQKRCFQ